MATIKLFGTMRLNTGIKTITADIGNVEEACAALVSEARRINPDTDVSEKTFGSCIVMINGIQASTRSRVKPGDELVFLSPAGGG